MLLHIFLLFFSGIALASSQTTNYRLPEAVKPSHYDVFINTDFNTFNGTVSINLRASQRPASITLHSKELTLSNIRFTTQPAGSNLNISGFTSNLENDFFSMGLTGYMIANASYTLTLDFSGTLGSENHIGFYKAVYQDENDIPRVLATTQFEPTYARRAFPCFDQPDFKATFQIRLVRDSNLRTTSNMFLESGLPWEFDETKILDVYSRTPLMSTYLVAFTISDYARIFNGTHSIYGRKELLDRGEGEYALGMGRAVINAMAAYTEIDYTFLKLDQFAVPNDYYQFGAMENWGMVTYRELCLMYNVETSTTAEKQITATTVAHAIANQWFGNLVTPRWWKYIWLNEGFATYLKMVIVNQLEPEWNFMDQFVISILQPAFDADSVLSTTAMNKDVEAPSEIEIFMYDPIIYNKAASVVRMTQAFLGESPFKTGLTKYLTDWSFKNVESVNLYTCWQEALGHDGINVTEVLQKWETEKGYPVVTVNRDYDTKTINLIQKKFLMKGPLDTPSLSWPIPLNFMYSIKDNFDFSLTLPDYWFTELRSTIRDESPESFIIVNKGVTGYYRVNYDVTNWNNIITFLMEDEFTKIPTVNRAQLLDDAFNLARAGELDYKIALELSTYIIREREYVPLTSFFNAARFLNTMLRSYNEYYSYFKTYMENLLVQISKELTFEEMLSDNRQDRLTRINVMNWLCDVAGGECRQKSLDIFRKWKLTDVAALKPDLQLYAYCGALREGDQSDWDFLFKKYQLEHSDSHRTRILNALGCSEDAQILTRLLDMTIDPEIEFFKDADRETAFTSVYNSGRVGLSVAFDYVLTKYVGIYISTLNLNNIIMGLSSRPFTASQIEEFLRFLQSVSGIIVPDDVTAAAWNNAVDTTVWSAENVPVIFEWLMEYTPIVISTTEGSEDSEATESTETIVSTVESTVPTTSTIESTVPTTSTVESTVPTTSTDESTSTVPTISTVESTPTVPTTSTVQTTPTVETTTAGGTIIGVSLALSIMCLVANAAVLK